MVFGRFTEKSQKVLLKASDYSKKLKHGYIGTEHILLGLASSNGKIKGVLENHNVTLSNIQNIISHYIGEGDINYFLDDIPITPIAKSLMDLSINEAKSLGQNYITPEHILIALTKEREGLAFIILTNLNVDLDKLREDSITLLKGANCNILKNQENYIQYNNKLETLNRYGKELNLLAEEDRLEPVVGRDNEIERVLEILCRKIKNNPCLIGEPGVGKTAIIEGIAKKIVEGKVPKILKNKRIFSLSLTSIIAGAKYRGEFEERLKKIIDEISKEEDIILFIDEIHTIIGAGGAEGAIDASNILKPFLARGEIQCIGATTIDEYAKYIEKDSAFARRFQSVFIEEPNNDDTLKILKGIRRKYEIYHGVKITDKALTAAIELSDRYIQNRYMPDKAIDLIDEASAKVKINNLNLLVNFKELKKNLKINRREHIYLDKLRNINIRDFKKYKLYYAKEKDVKNYTNIVGEEEIASVVSKLTKIPLQKINEKESIKLLKLENLLYKRVIGQTKAIESISRAVRRGRVGLKDPKRPIGSFIFVGPTGVGKTELSKALAEIMFGDEKNIIRLDMSEYMESNSLSRLIGSSPGYVGYEEGGCLTDAVRKNPYSVVLFDEIEKANKDIFNILLQILDDGILTDGKGKSVDFKNTIIIMTSNIGAHSIKSLNKVGFSLNSEEGDNNNFKDIEEDTIKEVNRFFRPEFLNRIDDIIVFNPLKEEELIKIMEIMLSTISKRLKEKEIFIEFTEESKRFLVSKDDNLDYGARPLRKIITRYIEDKLSEEILRGNIKRGDSIKAIIQNKNLLFINN
ncbi:ATP-dependent Clp protease ATP-binding subunit [Clostridium fallax]|uniref:ATP-dependent Clp protease ATP-binding subunit ClpC n=1 Tax=Clostridium fallax TaxID=1533 RepID=A0A1M4TMG8_9CLOT|nr:ATP-dependent Clp protease ATP-binding subunit [Clostridium fallax]SHE45586.1 ATP-dependent Clp protease ATP-binding subunit ClpC [Clostridium fallax]SQB22495.1 negative regulator of genetic competence mecB/clpC [Clostridium fallax]